MGDGQTTSDGHPAYADQIHVSYSTLHDAATDLKGLAPDLGKFKVVDGKRGFNLPTESGTVERTAAEVGNGGFGESLATFYLAWGTPMSDAAGWVQRLQSFFETTADAFMNADAQSAAAINASATLSAVDGYAAQMTKYYQELDTFGEQNPYTDQFVSTGNFPDMPVPVANPYSISPGVSTTFNQGNLDENPPAHYDWPLYLPTTETTTVNSGGLTYSETTTFGPDKGWGPGGPTQDTTQVITHPDGTVETITDTVNLDGSATQKDVSVSSSSTTTTTATRADWTAQWVDTTPVTDQGNVVPTNPGPDLGAPMVN